MHKSAMHVCKMKHPGDTDEFRRLLDDEVVDIHDVQGVMITHEGDLVANAYAARCYAEVIADRLGMSTDDVTEDFPIQALAGAVGFMTPHALVLTRTRVDNAPAAGNPKRLAIAGMCTRRFLPEEIGTAAYIEEVSRCVSKLYEELEVEAVEDVGLVFCKAGWPGARHRPDAESRGARLRSDDFMTSGAFARGGAALGVAHALGEVPKDADLEARLTADSSLYSTVAHCSSTEERQSVAVIMFANTRSSASPQVIGRAVMRDGLDADTPRQLAAALLGTTPDRLPLEKVEYAFLKPKTSEAPDLRGERHTLVDHPTVGYMWWMIEKAPVHAVVASALSRPLMEVATGPEHQGPPGQPLVALVARVDD